MKELSIEQKAKAYDEAIEVARKYWNSPRTCIDIDVLPELFPEIKEIDDEEMRKGLIAIITDFDSLYLQENYSLSREEAIAWLEKQGEQKILEEKADLEKAMANILKVYAHTILCRSLTQDELNKTDAYAIENTKKLLDYFVQREQLSATWSEEDENLLKLSLVNLTELKDRFGEEYGKVGDCIVWFESIKDRYAFKPSKEQLNGLKEAIEFLGCTKTRREQLQSLYEQLKKLREG